MNCNKVISADLLPDARGIRLGVERTEKILKELSNPDEKLKIIHIAGTNGKGSTAEYFTCILVAAGKKTGTFLSPQVYSFYDQIKIDGKSVSSELYEKYKVNAEANKNKKLTATALALFAGEGCEWAVIECGMGGKTDATNAISKKELAVINSVSLEHTDYLGATVREICAQKAGIIKNCPVIINAHQTKEAREYFAQYRFADKLEQIFEGGFVYGGKTFALKAEGCLQPCNAACAIEGARLLGIDESAIELGVAQCLPRGRLEKFFIGGREYILDGAHNPEAFVPLKKYLLSRDCFRTVIFGCLKDKDIDGCLHNVIANEVIAVECPSERTRSLEDVAALCRRYFGKNRVDTAESVSSALDKASGEVVAVCGSFTILEEAKRWIEKRL